MRIELLSTGDELLDGSVLDTNTAWFSERAFELGATVARKETLPDDLPTLVEAMRQMGARADFVVVSGGLGPTVDDVTAEAAAQAAGVPLVVDGPTLARLKARFASRGIAFTPNNVRQARVPQGSTVYENPFGSAPLFVTRIGRAEFHFLPGVPREFRGLCEAHVLPALEKALDREPGRVFRAGRVLKAVGIPESHLDALVADLRSAHPHVRFGFRTHAPENHLKLLATGASAAEAAERLAEVEQQARSRLGAKLFGVDRDEFPETVFAALEASGRTVALAESCTGGLCASLLASVPGASRRLVFSAVVYQEQAKTELLGVPAELVRRAGAVSAEVTRALADAARARGSADYGLAVTGWAGPGGGSEQEPVGTVYLCLSGPEGATEARHHFAGERERVRLFAAYQALELLRQQARGTKE